MAKKAKEFACGRPPESSSTSTAEERPKISQNENIVGMDAITKENVTPLNSFPSENKIRRGRKSKITPKKRAQYTDNPPKDKIPENINIVQDTTTLSQTIDCSSTGNKKGVSTNETFSDPVLKEVEKNKTLCPKTIGKNSSPSKNSKEKPFYPKLISTHSVPSKKPLILKKIDPSQLCNKELVKINPAEIKALFGNGKKLITSDGKRLRLVKKPLERNAKFTAAEVKTVKPDNSQTAKTILIEENN